MSFKMIVSLTLFVGGGLLAITTASSTAFFLCLIGGITFMLAGTQRTREQVK